MKRAALALCVALCMALLIPAPRAHADLCPYPGVGVGVNIFVGRGFFCDYPTEINGSHMHCEGGGVGISGVGGLVGAGENGSGSFVAGGSGVGGSSCSWRCPDGVLAPQPNPPGAWKDYLSPMTSTNFCRDHMAPNGFWSAPVLPTEGIPPVGQVAPQPGETPIPQPVPAPLPVPAAPPSAVPPPPIPPPLADQPNNFEPNTPNPYGP